MKKFKFLFLILIFVLSLVGCGDNDNQNNNDKKDEQDQKDINTIEQVQNLDYYSNHDTSNTTSRYYIRFDKVEGATSYIVKVNTKEFETTENDIDINTYCIANRTINVSVRAVKKISEDNIIKSYPTTMSFKSGNLLGDNLYCYELEDGTYCLNAVKCTQSNLTGEIVIPDYCNGKKITKIYEGSFYRQIWGSSSGGQEWTTKVTLPRYLEEIGKNAFSFCGGIKEVVVPNTLKTIGEWAFGKCVKLTSFDFTNIETIDYAGFKNSGLTEAKFGDKITEIGVSAFYGCSSLETVTYGDSLQFVGKNAFDETPWLSNQTDDLIYMNDILIHINKEIPSKITKDFFRENTKVISYSFMSMNIESFELPNTVERVCDQLLCQTTIKEVIFEKDSKLKEFSENMFNNCKSLTSITVSASVEKIATGCFAGCEDITINYEKVPEVLTGLGNLKFETYEIPYGVKVIGEYCFNYCSNLKNIIIPDTVVEIQNGAFYGCYNLTQINLPSSVKIIGSYGLVKNGEAYTTDTAHGAFGNTGLTSVILPDVDVLGWLSFNSNKLEYIVLPKYIEHICYGSIYAGAKIFYLGTSEDYKKMKLINVSDKVNNSYKNVYYYTETKPETEGLYWHYVDNVPTVWN